MMRQTRRAVVTLVVLGHAVAVCGQSPTAPPTSPTEAPIEAPTESPTQAPTESPTPSPTPSPTQSPTESPTRAPTESPTRAPTRAPTNAPTSPCTPFTTAVDAQGTPQSTSTVNVGAAITVTCNPNHRFRDGTNWAATTYQAVCGGDGQYHVGTATGQVVGSGTTNQCVRAQCSGRRQSNSNRASGTFSIPAGGTATVECDTNFGVGGNARGGTAGGSNSEQALACSDTGQSSQPNLPSSTADICQRINCGPIPTRDAATTTVSGSSTQAGDTVIYSCATNFGVEGGPAGDPQYPNRQFSLRCDQVSASIAAQGDWKETVQQLFQNANTPVAAQIACAQITCPVSNLPNDPDANQPSVGTVNAGSAATYDCIANHAIGGGFGTMTTNAASCTQNGAFTARAPLVNGLGTCIATCNDGTQYTNAAGACFNCRTCSRPERETGSCGATSTSTGLRDVDRICTACTAGFFLNVAGDDCSQCTKTCTEGRRVVGDCTPARLDADPWSCASCPGGTYTAAGSYSLTFGDSNNRCLNCGAGYRCPVSGSGASRRTTRVACSAHAEYQSGTTAQTCASVTPGFYSLPANGTEPNTGQEECEAGNKCVGGVKIPCYAANAYQASTGNTSCTVVPEGSYKVSNSEIRSCEAGFRCTGGVRRSCSANTQYQDRRGQSQCRTVSTGHFSTPTGNSNANTGQAPCPRGSRCVGGVRSSCTNDNQFQNLTAQTSCQTVARGYYSFPEPSTRANHTEERLCGAGTFCFGGLRRNCSVDLYQPSAGEDDCVTLAPDAGMVYSGSLRIGAVLCAPGDGFYCTGTDPTRSDRIRQECPVGFECTGGSAPPAACVDGATYAEVLRQASCATCSVCPRGQNVTRPCTAARNTACSDTVAPFFVGINNTVNDTIEAHVGVFELGNGDPTEAYDLQGGGDQDLSTFPDAIRRQCVNRPGVSTTPVCQSLHGLFAGQPFIDGRSSVANTSILGTHVILYTATDRAVPPNTATATRTVRVTDTLAPVTTLVSPDTMELDPGPIGGPRWTQAMVSDRTQSTAFDVLEGAAVTARIYRANSNVLLDRLLAPVQLGPVVIEHHVSDHSGNNASVVTQSITIVDRTPPDVTTVSSPFIVQANSTPAPFARLAPNASAADYVDGSVAATLYNDTVVGNRPGEYVATYQATDTSGNQGFASMTVSVRDTLAPDLVLVGPASLDWNYGDAWEDPGFAAADNLDPSAALEARVVVSAPPDVSAPLGTESVLTYNLQDDAGNSIPAPLTRTVFIRDLAAPVVTPEQSDATVPFGGLVPPPPSPAPSPPVLYQDSCATAQDNHDGRLPVSSLPQCVDTETFTGTRESHVFYRTGFLTHLQNAFNESGTFIITYEVEDNQGNTGRASRNISILAAAASSGATDGSGAIVASVVVVIILVVVVAAVLLKRRRDQEGRALRSAKGSAKNAGGAVSLTHFVSPAFNAAAARPPPREMWYHGHINRNEAEDRIMAMNIKDGVFLLRSRGKGDGEYAISLRVGGRIVHYTVTVPLDRSSALVIQGKPTPPTFGSCISDIIAHLREKQPGFPVATGLRVAASIPTPNRTKLVQMVQRRGTETAYNIMTADPTNHSVSSGFVLDHSGLYYPIFVAPAWVHAGIPLYACDRFPDGSSKFTQVDPACVGPAVPLFIMVKHQDLPHHLDMKNDKPSTDDDGPVMYSSVLTGGVGQSGPDGVVYSAVDVGPAQVAPGANESGVLYSAVDVGGGPAQVPGDAGLIYTSPFGTNSEEGIVYSSVDIGGATMDDSGVTYTDVSIGGPRRVQPIHQPLPTSDDVVYSEVSTGAAVQPPAIHAHEAEAHLYTNVNGGAAPGGGGAAPVLGPRAPAALVPRPSARHAGAKDATPSRQPPKKQGTAPLHSAGARQTNGAGKGERPKSLRLSTNEDTDWLHDVNRGEAEARLTAAGKVDGMYLIRPHRRQAPKPTVGKACVLSIVLRGRFVHRLIEPTAAGGFTVDKVDDNWGTTLAEVTSKLEQQMMRKHALNQCRQLLVSDLSAIGAEPEC